MDDTLTPEPSPGSFRQESTKFLASLKDRVRVDIPKRVRFDQSSSEATPRSGRRFLSVSHWWNNPVKESLRSDGIKKPRSRPLRCYPITFAVDVSKSTEKAVLAIEKEVIHTICAFLDKPNPEACSFILPWHQSASDPLLVAEAGRLTANPGTNPAALLANGRCLEKLRASDLWFLMTDGLIEEEKVRTFARGLPRAGLHGAASIIVLFNTTRRPPHTCNVSVGKSVFAVSPHCIFLFHDIRTSEVYVIQAKGCFSDILPETRRFVSITNDTKWEDLPQIEYDDLANAMIPPATKLGETEILLPDGNTFDMNDIYNNTLSDADKLKLLADYEALDVIILAAQTRGRESGVRDWIKTCTARGQDLLWMDRKDMAERNGGLIRTIFNHSIPTEMMANEPERFWGLLRIPHDSWARLPLRLNHNSDWSKFIRRRSRDDMLAGKINETVSEVMHSMNVYSTSANSPAILTPLSSPVETGTAPICTTYSLRSANVRHPTPSGRMSSPLSARSLEPASLELVDDTSNEVLFLQGFKGQRRNMRTSSSPWRYGRCPICHDEDVIQTLLLCSSSGPDPTPHFPSRESASKHKFPLILGNFPETDIVAPITTCDACAFSLLKYGELPNGDTVTAALPLVSLEEDVNYERWEGILRTAYGNRFHKSLLFLVFLSSLASAIEDIVAAEEPHSNDVVRTLEHCCLSICNLGPAPGFDISEVPSPRSAVSSWPAPPLALALRQSFGSIESPILESPLLGYPVEGFVVAVRLAGLIPGITSQSIGTFVWKRLLYHFTERHYSLQKQHGTKGALDQLREILFSAGTKSVDITANARLSVSLESLGQTYLFPAETETADHFQRLGSYFTPIASLSYSSAIALFLHELLALVEVRPIDEPLSYFSDLRGRISRTKTAGQVSADLILDPTGITTATAKMLIRKAYDETSGFRFGFPGGR